MILTEKSADGSDTMIACGVYESKMWYILVK
jgi:hypothetical protein